MAVLRSEDMRAQPHAWWLGTAWYDPSRNVYIVFPVPFNRIARAARWCWYWLIGGRGDRWTTQLLLAQQQGRDSVMESAMRLYDAADQAREDVREERRKRDEFMAEYGAAIRRLAEGLNRVKA